MSRCRFVQPEVVRLFLADVHKRAHAALELLVKEGKAKAEELIASAQRVSAAEADGAFVDVKKQLTAGEQRRVFSGMVKDMTAGEKVSLDPAQVGLTKLVEYLVGWSLTDPDGKPVPVSADAIDNLEPDTYAEITAAIDWHIETDEAAREARKNVTAADGARR